MRSPTRSARYGTSWAGRRGGGVSWNGGGGGGGAAGFRRTGAGAGSGSAPSGAGRRLLSLLAGLLFATALPAQTPTYSLWVTLGDSDQLVELDPYSFQELRRIKVDPK